MAKSSPRKTQSANSGNEYEAVGPETRPIDQTRVLTLLTEGQMEERGLLPYSSNYSFLVTLRDGEVELPGVYKPRRGENPLWDFATGTLCLRETAAYVISAALEWALVPPTVLRDGTRGIGSVQLFIECDPDIHYFSRQEDARYATALRRLSLFDFVVNNADRKSGHCLFGDDQRMWAIDHGICFHSEYKLRTVIWEYSGQPIASGDLQDLAGLQECLETTDSPLNAALGELLSRPERTALCARLDRLVAVGRHPLPPAHQRNYPWPPI
ncbi:MAG: SCO1664 family protein [Caldilineaceae bacterium]|nr:SCO1664 family protein [Caldilineaceae bacterium]